jgi:methionyl-tRNA synthetase
VSGKFYITTAIDYANGDPHLGHAYEKIGADCIARYRRLRGDRVHFVIGMDEHGQKVKQAADAAGIAPQEWVDRTADLFRSAWRDLDISNTDFIQTTEARHTRTVLELVRRIEENGHFYEGSYSGYYCVGCEAFKQERDLVEGKCPDHPTREIRWVEEVNYFFRWSHFERQLLDLYDAQPDFLRPTSKMNEIRNLVEGGLQDISVSRARLPWGIPWPNDETHSIYVWFDALINYLSATGFPDSRYSELWPADLHVIGPDIARFHAALWPAMLMAADIPSPKGVWSHGWMTFSGTRFSKSEGVSVTLPEAVARHGSDPLRYFLLREVPWDANGNFSFERYDGRYAAELADGYGNLASRVLAMVVKYRDGKIPDTADTVSLDTAGGEIIEQYSKAMDAHLLHVGGSEAWRLVSIANSFVEESAPWTLAREGNVQKLDAVLAGLTRAVARITIMAAPFMPGKAGEVWRAIGMPSSVTEARWDDLVAPQVRGLEVVKPPPLFPKVAQEHSDLGR